MEIRIFYDDTSYRVPGWKKIRKTVYNILRAYRLKPERVNIIITTDDKLININKHFLNHNYFTDVITFSEVNEKSVSGEVYISIDTVKLNSINYNVSLKDEVYRVIIHGILHMCGLDDSDDEQKAVMRKNEDFWLSKVEK